MNRLNLLFMLFLLTSTSFPVRSVAFAERKCTIKQFVGSVKIRRGESTAWSDARLKLPLREKDALRTFIESEAELETTEGTTIKIGENTTIEMSTFFGDTEKQNTTVKILNGAVLANVKKLVSTNSSFSFETPTATAAIRGTRVGFEVSKEITKVKVYDGNVWVVPVGTTQGVLIQPDHMGIVKKGEKGVTVGKLEDKNAVVASPSESDSIPSDSVTSDTGVIIDSTLVPDTAGQSFNPSLTTSQKILLTISSPAEGQEFKKPLIPVSGRVSPGAEVIVMSIKLPVNANGQFSGQIPIANETGSYDLEFEASLNGVSQKIRRRISYKPEYRFILTTPTDHQIITTTMIPVRGEILPVNAEVTVMGNRMSVSGSGQFSGIVSIPDEEGEIVMDIEVSAPGFTRNETRRVVYKRPPDSNRPQLSVTTSKNCWSITVFDRTVEEEITLSYSIDNVQDNRILRPNESVCIPFEEGVHSYSVFAKDKSGNLSSTETLRSYSYLATTTWFIKMRKPSGSIVINLPPASPAGETSVYTVEFTLENLPDDNMKLIREVNITNKTNSKKVTLRTFTDNFIDADVELTRNTINHIQVDAKDINNFVKNYDFQITVK